jgi:hypothetical protein
MEEPIGDMCGRSAGLVVVVVAAAVVVASEEVPGVDRKKGRETNLMFLSSRSERSGMLGHSRLERFYSLGHKIGIEYLPR